MNKPLNYTLLASFVITLIGCTTIPEGPRITALPGSNKTMILFDQDRLRCKEFALSESGGKTANQVKDDTTGEHAMIGTIVGALIGAAFGHHGGESVAIGAATGMLFGAISGSDEGYIAGDNIQHRYDNAYTRCMYSAGHRVPVKIKYIEQPSINITAPIPDDSPDGTPYGVPPDFKPK
jgi:YmgG-like glycine-zipper protein